MSQKTLEKSGVSPKLESDHNCAEGERKCFIRRPGFPITAGQNFLAFLTWGVRLPGERVWIDVRVSWLPSIQPRKGAIPASAFARYLKASWDFSRSSRMNEFWTGGNVLSIAQGAERVVE